MQFENSEFSNNLIYQSFSKQLKKNPNELILVEDQQTSYCSSYNSESLCPFCQKLQSQPECQNMLNTALYSKYSSSQNFYYKKEIQNFFLQKYQLKMETRKKMIAFQDTRLTQDCSEYLFGSFNLQEIPDKVAQLVEYYKFHNEIPRIFQKSFIKVIFKYHDKTRKVQFARLQKLLLSDGDEKNLTVPTHNYPSLLKSLVTNHENIFKQSEEMDAIHLKYIIDSFVQLKDQTEVSLCSNFSQLVKQQSYFNNNMLTNNLSYSAYFEKSLSDLLQYLNKSQKKIIKTKQQIFPKQILEKFQSIQQQYKNEQSKLTPHQDLQILDTNKQVEQKTQPSPHHCNNDQPEKCLYTYTNATNPVPKLAIKIENSSNKQIKQHSQIKTKIPTKFTITASNSKLKFFKPNYASQTETNQRCQTFNTAPSQNSNIKVKFGKQTSLSKRQKDQSSSPYPKKLSIQCQHESSEYKKIQLQQSTKKNKGSNKSSSRVQQHTPTCSKEMKTENQKFWAAKQQSTKFITNNQKNTFKLQKKIYSQIKSNIVQQQNKKILQNQKSRVFMKQQFNNYSANNNNSSIHNLSAKQKSLSNFQQQRTFSDCQMISQLDSTQNKQNHMLKTHSQKQLQTIQNSLIQTYAKQQSQDQLFGSYARIPNIKALANEDFRKNKMQQNRQD